MVECSCGQFAHARLWADSSGGCCLLAPALKKIITKRVQGVSECLRNWRLKRECSKIETPRFKRSLFNVFFFHNCSVCSEPGNTYPPPLQSETGRVHTDQYIRVTSEAPPGLCVSVCACVRVFPEEAAFPTLPRVFPVPHTPLLASACLRMRKLRFREVKELLAVTEVFSRGSGI